MLIPFLTFSQNNNFYYFFNKKIDLTPIANNYTIEFKLGVDENLFTNNDISFELLGDNFYKVTSSYTQLLNLSTNQFDFNPIYTTNQGTEIKLKNQIILKFSDNVNEAQKQILIAQFGLTEFRITRLYKIYNVNNPLTISQLIYETGLVRYCHPVFPVEIVYPSISSKYTKFAKNYDLEKAINNPTIDSTRINEEGITQFIPNDEYFSNQWHLHNTGQELNDGHFGTPDADIDAPEAWNISLGSNSVVIAVPDTGVTFNHPDLPNSRQLRLSGSMLNENCAGFPNDPSPCSETNSNAHGTKAAGLIAAEINNNEGIVGVCPECIIMPVVHTNNNNTFGYTIADSITFPVDNGADIISNSWALVGGFLPELVVAIEDAIESNIIVIFAAGNTANHINGNPGGILFPSNQNIENLIVVGASDRNDLQANYSPTSGASGNISISAPSGTAPNWQIPGEAANIWTTDLLGVGGTNPYNVANSELPPTGEELPSSGINYLDYTGRFSGTSASTPIVAGVVGLIKSVNPCLSLAQTLNILKYTADKVGPYDYNWNPDKVGHSRELGYGRVNAYKAVNLAQQVNSSSLDLFAGNSTQDFGIEPDQASGNILWQSPNIWVRNLADGIEEHQNPEYDPDNPNYVYVRIVNKSCEASTGNDPVQLYWAKANTALNWPNYWNGSIIIEGVTMGGLESTQNIPALAPGEETILEFEWQVPNPEDYIGINPNPWHFCLLARINTSNDPMTFPEVESITQNVKNNNNLAWKNTTVVEATTATSSIGGVIAVCNPYDEQKTYQLEFVKEINENGKAIYDEAELSIKMDDILYNAWTRGGNLGTNFVATEDERTITVIDNQVILDDIQFNSNEYGTLYLSFNFLTKELTNKTKFTYHVIQRDMESGEIIGGETFVIKKPERAIFYADAGDDQEINTNESITLSAEELNEAASYNWYNTNGDLVYTGKNFTISPEVNKKYKLEITALADGFKDYDEIDINIKSPEITTVVPNPASGSTVVVNYQSQNSDSLYLVLTPLDASFNDIFTLDLNQTTKEINILNYTTGLYFISLIANGQVVDQNTLIIQ